MASETVTVPLVQPPSGDIEKLKATVKEMDGLSQRGFSEIASIAKMAIAWLETPVGQRDIDTVTHALECIRDKAEDVQNSINCSAEEVGCHYMDDAWVRRVDAWEAMREQEAVWAHRSVAHSAKETEHV